MQYFVKSITKIFTGMLAIFVFFAAVPNFTQQNSQATDKGVDKYLYGIAALYTTDLEGQNTASGEIYTDQGLTVAHRSLPFGTRIEIENLSNGKKVHAIVNDRGPFEKNRILNVSKKIGEILGFISEGTTFVKVTVLELGTTLRSPMTESIQKTGVDIPQNFTQENSDTEDDFPIESGELEEEDISAVTQEIDDFDIFSDDELFANLDEEFSFMDDESEEVLINEKSDVRAQGITSPSFPNTTSQIDPIGFDPNVQDIIIDDPLSNIVISSNDEYEVATPETDLFVNTVPYDITSEEEDLLANNAEDPFSDLFNDNSDPYSFQDTVAENAVYPIVSDIYNTGNNIGEDVNNPVFPGMESEPIVPSKPVVNAVTNFVTITNEVTKEITNEVVAPRVESNMHTNNTYTNLNNTNTYEPINNIKDNSQDVVPQKLGDHYVIQLGAFSKQKNALELYENLRKDGFNAYITDVKIKGKNLMRVRVGYFTTVDEALQASQKIEKTQKIENRIIKVEYDEQ